MCRIIDITPFLTFRSICLFHRKQLIVLPFVLSLFFLLASQTCANSFSVGYSHYPPFQRTGNNGQAEGLDIDILNAVLRDAGYSANYKKMPWTRQIQVGIKNGELDILLQAKRIKEREAFAYFSDQMYIHVKNALFIRRQDSAVFQQVNRLTDLIDTDLTIGITRGSTYSEEYGELIHEPKFMARMTDVNKDEQNIGMLLSGRIDGFLATDLSTIYLLNQHPKGKHVKIHMFLENEDVLSQGSVFMFSKKNMTPSQVERINQSLAKLLADGTIDKIIAKHNQGN